MRQGQNRRPRGRNPNNTGGGNSGGNNNRRNTNQLTRSFESNGPDVKVRGTPQHIAEKYVQLSRDAQASGDPVMAENYLQHAEHYYRIVLAAQEEMTQKYGHQFAPQRNFNEDGDEDGDEGDDGSNGGQPDMSQPIQSAPQSQQNGYAPQQGEGGQRFDRNQGDRNQNRDGSNPRRFDRQDRNNQDRGGQDRGGQDRGDNRFDRNEPRQDSPRQDSPRQDNQNRDGQQRGDYQGRGNGERFNRNDRPPRDFDRNRNTQDSNRQDRPYGERNQNERAAPENAPYNEAPQPVVSVEPRNPRGRMMPVDDDGDVGGLPAFVTAPKRQIINLEPPASQDDSGHDAGAAEAPKRGRGRPRKVTTVATGNDAE
jgi:hypothetical protein